MARDPGGAWTHPQQNFYAPGQPAPSDGDLAHLLVNDAAVVVRYRPEASGAAREALREWAGKLSSVVVVPALSSDAVQVEAYTSNRRLICDGIDATQLTAFADRRGSLQIETHNDTG